jgi:hypothetical protein
MLSRFAIDCETLETLETRKVFAENLKSKKRKVKIFIKIKTVDGTKTTKTHKRHESVEDNFGISTILKQNSDIWKSTNLNRAEEEFY